MDFPAISQSTGSPRSSSDGTAALSQLGEDYTTFLRLLTAQISNQDPLQPIDSTTFVTQLAQLSQVEQAAQTNTNLANLSAQLDSLTLISGASALGQGVNVQSNQLILTEEGAQASYRLDATATTVSAEVYDPTGQLIHVIERLPGEPGVEHAFSWDGRTNTNQQALLGAYSVRLVALDAREAEVSSTMYRDGRIEAVDLSFGELNYVLEGGEVVATGKLRRLG